MRAMEAQARASELQQQMDSMPRGSDVDEAELAAYIRALEERLSEKDEDLVELQNKVWPAACVCFLSFVSFLSFPVLFSMIAGRPRILPVFASPTMDLLGLVDRDK